MGACMHEYMNVLCVNVCVFVCVCVCDRERDSPTCNVQPSAPHSSKDAHFLSSVGSRGGAWHDEGHQNQATI